MPDTLILNGASQVLKLYSGATGPAGAGLADGDKGDITVSASGATWTIDANAVTYSKIQDVTGEKLLGNATLVAMSPAEIGVGTGFLFSGGNLTLKSEIAALAALTSAADTFAYYTGVGTAALSTITAFARTLLDDASAAAFRTTLGIDVDDAVTFGDLTVNNLTVNGTVLTVNTATATVDDPLIRLGDNNPADSVDLGWYGVYVSGGTKFAGIFRDASDGKFRVFSGTGTEPTTTVDIGAAGYSVATLVANLESSNVTITGGNITGITDLAIADGGTGASTAAGARTNLGLEIGTNVQAQDAELQAIAGLVSAADKGLYFTGSGTAALYDLTAFARGLLDDADAITARETLDVLIEPTAALVGKFHKLRGQLSDARWQHIWSMPNNSTTVSAVGYTLASSGTISTPALGGTFATGFSHWQNASAAPLNSFCEQYTSNRFNYRRGSIHTWFIAFDFCCNTAPATGQVAFGLVSNNGAWAYDRNLTNEVDCLFVGWQNGDANLSVFHNDGAGVATKIDLGANFPARTTAAVYRVFFFWEAGGTAVYYQVDRLDSWQTTSGTIAAEIPTADVGMTHRWYASNGDTASAAQYLMHGWNAWHAYNGASVGN